MDKSRCFLPYIQTPVGKFNENQSTGSKVNETKEDICHTTYVEGLRTIQRNGYASQETNTKIRILSFSETRSRALWQKRAMLHRNLRFPSSSQMLVTTRLHGVSTQKIMTAVRTSNPMQDHNTVLEGSVMFLCRLLEVHSTDDLTVKSGEG
jgi:exopolysaccharide biosynthesis predicted pyruvyltransferase EpsI